MDKNKKWIDYIIELQSLAQAGLTYGKDVYDQERLNVFANFPL